MVWSLQFLGYLRTLSLKFPKAKSKIEVDSQQGRDRKTTVLVIDFWNFKLKVLKYPWNFRPHATVISKLAVFFPFNRIYLSVKGKLGWCRTLFYLFEKYINNSFVDLKIYAQPTLFDQVCQLSRLSLMLSCLILIAMTALFC